MSSATSHTNRLSLEQRRRAERIVESCLTDEDSLRLIAYEYVAMGDALTAIVRQHEHGGGAGPSAIEDARVALNGCEMREATR